MKNFSKSANGKIKKAFCSKAEGLGLKCFRLPVQLESELELPRVVSRGGLTGEASCASGRIAKLVYRCHVGAIEKIKGVRDQVKPHAFAKWNSLRYPQIHLEKTWRNKMIAA